MIPYGKQFLDKHDKDAVLRVLGSDFLTQGPEVLRFEKALARAAGARYVVAASSGTAALHLAYRAAGLAQGNEVITTPNTFVATANMLLAVGAKPVFCDIRPDTANIDEAQIEKYITRRTRAIAPVHFAGHPCEMEKILRVAKKHGLLVVEDACHALGARYRNKKVGSMGDMTVFSFHPVKPITTGEGGAVATNSRALYEKLRSLRSHGVHKDRRGKNVMTELGYNYRLTDIQAALGRSQLQKLSSFLKKRREVARWYKEELADARGLTLPQELVRNYSGWHIYVVRLKNPRLRDKLAAHLKKNGVGANFHYPAVYSHPYYREHGYKKTKLPNEEAYQSSCITLPLHPGIRKKDVRFVSGIIKKFLQIHGD